MNAVILKQLLIRCVVFVGIINTVILADPPAGTTWVLNWADEFNGAINYNLWTNWRDSTWRDNSGHHVFLCAAKALSVTNGCAVISVKKSGDTAYSSGLWTKAGYGPGYYEARVKSGHAWAGFWVQAMGSDCAPITGGCEYDIMENCCPGTIQHNVHWGGYGSCHQMAEKHTTFSQDSFYVFGLQWSTTSGATFYVNGKVTHTVPTATPNNTGKVILSVESEDTGTSFQIDYVRYYKANGASVNNQFHQGTIVTGNAGARYAMWKSMIKPSLVTVSGASRVFSLAGRQLGP